MFSLGLANANIYCDTGNILLNLKWIIIYTTDDIATKIGNIGNIWHKLHME